MALNVFVPQVVRAHIGKILFATKGSNSEGTNGFRAVPGQLSNLIQFTYILAKGRRS